MSTLKTHDTSPRANQFPFYLWLIGIYPILHLYSVNFGLVVDHEVLRTLIGMLSVITVAFSAAILLIRDSHKSAFLVSVSSISFSLSGHVYGLFALPISLQTWTVANLIFLLLLIFAIHKILAAPIYARFTAPFNLIMLALHALLGITLARSFIATSPFVPILAERQTADSIEPPSTKISDSATHPDIYYIIPDGYPSDAWLEEAMNYDNSYFTDALMVRGFDVIHHAQSNYAATLVSLASTLNVQFYDSNPSRYADLDYLRLSIADSKIARQLQRLGYTYVQFLSGYLIPSPIADINRDFTSRGPLDIQVDQNDMSVAIIAGTESSGGTEDDLRSFYKQSFISLYFDTTMLGVINLDLTDQLFTESTVPYSLFAPERFLATIDEVESIVSMPEATFAIIHLLKPHRPTVFNANGEKINPIKYPGHDDYFAEFGFTNAKFMQMIDTILDGSKNPPVIIFQGDHGTTLGDVWSKDKRTTHFETYAAYYLPNQFSVDVPQPYTLINTFPLIMNEIFGTNLELKDDRLIELLIGYDAPFEQEDVTQEFAH